MEEVVLQRVRQFMKIENISIRELSKRFKITESTLGGKLNGSRKIDIEVVSLILREFPNLSAEWLLRGEGEMYKGGQLQPAPRMSFIDMLLQGLCNSDKKEVEKVKRVVDSVAELKENEE